MRRLRTLTALALLPLASCGGGGGGTVTSPSPTPPTSGAPTPTPTPAAVRFTVEAASDVPGFLALVVGDDPNAASPQAQFFTDLTGSVLPGTTTSPYGSGGSTSAGFPGFDFSANYALRAYGFENPSRIARAFTAPRKSTTVSPLTSLIQMVGSQESVKKVFGLGTGPTYQLPAGLDLTTYSATYDLDGPLLSFPGQIMSANLRVLALQEAVEAFEAAPGAPPVYAPGVTGPMPADARIAAYIKANPGAALDTELGLLDFLRHLRRSEATVYRDDVLQAAAALLHNFNLATRKTDNFAFYAERFSLALSAALRPRLEDLAERNSAAAAAAATVLPDAFQEEAFVNFADQQPFPTGRFLPVPDFFRVAAGGQLTVYRTNTPGFTPGGGVASRPNMIGNDVLWDTAGLRFASEATIRSVQVPAAQAGAIRAVLQADGSVLVTALPGFTGITWYEYATTLDSLSETGRVYLFVR